MNSVNFASYADDNKPYVIKDDVAKFIESLKEALGE